MKEILKTSIRIFYMLFAIIIAMTIAILPMLYLVLWANSIIEAIICIATTVYMISLFTAILIRKT